MFSIPYKLRGIALQALRGARSVATSRSRFSLGSKIKVTVFGASGDLGPALALLLHQSPHLDELALVDASPECGSLAGHLNALDNRALVQHHLPADAGPALRGAQVVVLADAALRTSGDARRARIERNAKKAAEVARLVGEHCPQAVVLVLTAPISGVVPVVVEAARRAGVPDCRVLGVPAASEVRAAAAAGALVEEDPFHIHVPVTGGTSASASVPLLSRTRSALTKLEAGAVVSAVQSAGSRLARFREESAVPALSVAYGAARFTGRVVRAVLGERGVREHAFVACDFVPGVPFLTVPVALHRGGARALPLGALPVPEAALLRAAARLVRRDLDVADHVVGSLFGPAEGPAEGAATPAASK